MPLRPQEQFVFGGVSSRDNPTNYPQNRCLRLRNFLLERSGALRLRDGYTPVTMNTVAGGAVHSIVGYKVLGGDRYAVFGQGNVVRVLNLRTGDVTAPTVRGTAIAGTGRWSWYLANNRLHGTNGTDRKFLMLNGGTWNLRDIGLRAPTSVEAAAVTVTDAGIHAGGVPASTVGGAQPGYQFYIAFWNRVTGAIGNRIKVGARILFTVDDHNVTLASLPVHSDTEVDILIGRSGDGAETPYAVTDASANWIYVAHGTTTVTVTTPGIDGAAELPTRNGQPPTTLTAVARAGDFVYGIVSDGPWIYRTEGGVDNLDAISDDTPPSIGRPEQCWPADNLEAFPTGDQPIGIHGYNGDCWVQTLEDLAILVDQQGIPGWQGPWANAGIAGQGAFTSGWKGLPYWINGHKQLMTMTPEGPITISDEYEAALLSQIGNTYLSQTQVVYFRDAELQMEIIKIKCRDSDGNPFVVVHDFNAQDSVSPGGQAMDQVYGNQLATDFYLASVRDNAEHAQLFAGASDGRIYQLLSGVSDNGVEFTADLISLPYFGPNRTAIPIIEWYGDPEVEWYISEILDKSINDIEKFSALKGPEDEAEEVPGDGENSHFRVMLPASELTHAYLWIRLRSHSADAPVNGMKLNVPPHLPVENYGRIHAVGPLVGTSRGK
jgi:hypothetical protein